MRFRFEHVATRRLVVIVTPAGLRHCLASRYWQEVES